MVGIPGPESKWIFSDKLYLARRLRLSRFEFVPEGIRVLRETLCCD